MEKTSNDNLVSFVEELGRLLSAAPEDSESCQRSLAKFASRMVNIFGFNVNGACEKICRSEKAKTAFFAVAVDYVTYYSELDIDRYTDDRNRLAVQTCHTLANADAWKGMLEKRADIDVCTTAFLAETRCMHRTLMQTFSQIVFRFLADYEPLGSEIGSRFGYSDWWRMPLI